jgi:phosphatidylglycerophosphatase C
VTRIAAFDLDGTLTTRDCVVPFLREVAGTGRIVAGLLRRPTDSGRALARRDRDALKQLSAGATFRDREVAPLELIATNFAHRVQSRWMRGETVALLEAHRDAGDPIVIVSASFEIYAAPLGRLLGVDEVLATRLEVADGRFTGSLDGANCRGPEKVVRLHRWLEQRGTPRRTVEVVAYGDSSGDEQLLADADVAKWIGTPR